MVTLRGLKWWTLNLRSIPDLPAFKAWNYQKAFKFGIFSIQVSVFNEIHATVRVSASVWTTMAALLFSLAPCRRFTTDRVPIWIVLLSLVILFKDYIPYGPFDASRVGISSLNDNF